MATISDNQKLLTIREFSAMSGLSVATIRRRVQDGSINAVQLGGKGKKLLFPRDVLERLAETFSPGEQNGSPRPGCRLSGRRPSWMANSIDSTSKK
jgi:excisionase family DNA binding protein